VRVSDAPDGSQDNNWSFSPKLDSDGHLVAFDSFASNLGGNPNSTVQVFLRDLGAGALEAISSLPGSTDFLEQGDLGDISPDGRFVVFDYRSSTVSPRAIVLLDRTTGSREIESVNDAGTAGNDDSFDPVVSADGRFVSFDSVASNLVSDTTNFRSDVFVRDRQAGTNSPPQRRQQRPAGRPRQRGSGDRRRRAGDRVPLRRLHVRDGGQPDAHLRR
jgi:Tol biopolymer transport system component